jgi:hypothetical protein
LEENSEDDEKKGKALPLDPSTSQPLVILTF